MPVNLSRMEIVPPLLPVPPKMLQTIKQTGALGMRMKKIVDVYNYLYILYYRLVKVKSLWSTMDDEKKATFVAENKALAEMIKFRLKKINQYLPQEILDTLDVSTLIPEINRVVKIVNKEDENTKYATENLASVALLKNAVKQLSVFLETVAIKTVEYANKKLGIRRGVGKRKMMTSQVFLGGRLKYNSDREQVMQEGKSSNPQLYNELQDVKAQHGKLMDKIIESQGMHELTEEELDGEKTLSDEDKVKFQKIFHAAGRGDLGVKFVANKTGEEFAVTKDGEIIPVKDYIEKRRERRQQLNKFNRTTGVQVDKNRFNLANDALVTKQFEAARDSDAIEWKALSDDLGGDKSLTKVFPIVKINGEEIIADGQFKGVPFHEMVNTHGRIFEASGYTFDEAGATLPKKVEYFTKTANVDESQEEEKELNFRLKTEPYVTLHEGKMLIAIPPIKTLVDKMMKLDDASHTMTLYTKRERDTKGKLVRMKKLLAQGKVLVWIFDVEFDFEMIRDEIGTLSMSKTAAKQVNDFLIKKRNAEISRKEKTYLNIKESDFTNLRQKTAEKNQDIKLFASQKESIQYVMDNGNGLIGLDTGCGKTLVAICIILKWLQDGTLRQKGRNGRALIVAEASLQGNFQREIENYCDNAKDIVKNVDIITYQGFAKGMMLGTAFKHGMLDYDKIENYGAVFFDEAQALKNVPKMRTLGGAEDSDTDEDMESAPDAIPQPLDLTQAPKTMPEDIETGVLEVQKKRISEDAYLDEQETIDTDNELLGKGIKKGMNRAMAAHALNHEHKILLTASVMEKNPMEMMNLVSITKNESLETLEIRKKEFKRKFLNTTGTQGGGRVTGVKPDKKNKRLLGEWVRTNCVSVKKDQNKIITTEGKEEIVPIPKLIKENPAITLDKRIQDAYLEIAAPMLNTLKKMTGEFEKMQKDTTKMETEGLGVLQKYTKGEGFANAQQSGYGEFIKIFRMLQLLSSAPTTLLTQYPKYLEARPEMKAVIENSYKYDEKLKYVTSKISQEQDEKWILWTDTPVIAEYYAKYLSAEFPSREVAVAQASFINVFRGDKRIKKYVKEGVETRIPDNEKQSRKQFEMNDWKDADGQKMKGNKNWQIDALKEMKNKQEVLILILTKAYTKGHNLQNFTRVIHLDRDSFNNQNMQQRDARNHRNGANAEKDMVSITPDAALDDKYTGFSVDKIRKYLQDLEEHIFDAVVRQSFKDVADRPYEMKIEGPGALVLEKKKEQFKKSMAEMMKKMRIDKKTLEFILAPTINSIKEIEK